MTYGFFAKRTDPPSSSLLDWLPASSFLSSPAAFPDPLSSPVARSRGSHHASQVLCSRPTTDKASLAISLALIGLLTPVPPGDSVSSPEVTRCSSVPCRPQTPWYGV